MADHAFKAVDDVCPGCFVLDVCGSALFLRKVLDNFIDIVACGDIDGDEFCVSSANLLEFFDEFFELVFFNHRVTLLRKL